MPVEPISHTLLWFILPATTTVIAAAGMTPNAADAWTAAGAMLGSFIAITESSQKRRGWAQGACILIASVVCGILTPGPLAEWCLSAENKARLTWQMWAIAGFFCAIPGWAVVLGILHWAKRLPANVEERLAKLTNTPTPPSPDE